MGPDLKRLCKARKWDALMILLLILMWVNTAVLVHGINSIRSTLHGH